MRRQIMRASGVAVVALAMTVEGIAQTIEKPEFEAASVRLAQPRTRPVQKVTTTSVHLVNQQLWSLLLAAFRIDEFRLSAPGWLRQVYLDVHARIPNDVPPQQWPEMLQALLRDRFDLSMHMESRPIDVYELFVGEGAIKMREVEPLDELTKPFTDLLLPQIPTRDVVRDTLHGRVRTIVLPIGVRTLTARTKYDQMFTERATRLNAARITMAELAAILTSKVDGPVIDKTELTGIYQFKIELPPDAGVTHLLNHADTTAPVHNASPTQPRAISVFKAVEGLGLRLERRRSSFNVVVVDRIAVEAPEDQP